MLQSRKRFIEKSAGYRRVSYQPGVQDLKRTLDFDCLEAATGKRIIRQVVYSP